MAPCQCGTSNPIDARFCSSCGSALGDQSGLLGVSSTVTNVTTTGGVDRRWMAIAALVFAAVIGWSVLSGGSGDAPLAEGAEQGAAPTTRPEPTTSAHPTTTTQRRPPTTGGLGPTVSIMGNGEPLLGEVTGLRLIIGQSAGRPSVLELDTGELVSGPRAGSRLDPITMSGDWMLARGNDRLVALPTNDLSAEATMVLPEVQGWVDFAEEVGGADGLAWVYVYDESPRLALVDLATGAAVDFAPDQVDLVSGTRWVSAGSSSLPALVNPRGGGIYEATDDAFEQVGDGLVVVADDRRVLVETCDERLQCRRTWFDRSTWEPIELAMPPIDADTMTFVNGSDWLILVRYWVNDAPTELFNVATGRSHEVPAAQFDPNADQLAAVSTDGRWLAVGSGSDVIVTDLDSGAEHVIEDIGSWNSRLIFTSAEVGYPKASSDVKSE